MKNLLFALLLLVSVRAFAQNFEGTMVWSIKTEITDPAMKAQMEEAQRSMQDPEKIKEMQEQMNNPQVKAMMEQNPQMKAQMEKAFKMMQSGGLTSMIPKGMTIKMKNGNAVTQMDGGFIDNEFLYLKDQQKTYVLDRENKTYSVSSSGNEQDSLDMKVKVTKTSDKARILGYTCTRYLVETSVNDKPIQQEVWATPEIKDIDFSSLASQRFSNSNQALFYKEIEGVPLKMEMKTAEMHMVMEATQLKRESLPASSFVIPADFKETKSAFPFGN